MTATPDQSTNRSLPEADAGYLPLIPGLWILALVCFVGNEFSVLFRYPDIGTAVLFPPYAALATALVVSRPRHWVWYVLVAATTHLVTHWAQWGVSWAIFADAANTARALTAAVLLRRVFRGPPRLDSVPMLAWFIVIAVIIAPAVGATLGAANVVLHGNPTPYTRAWNAWFLSNALTGLTILPAFLLAVGNRAEVRQLLDNDRRLIEAALLAVAVAATATIAFLIPTSTRWQLALIFYAPLPALIWAALRFGSGGASVALTVVSFAAMWGADRGSGPFIASPPSENVLVLQVFVLLTALPVLCIAAISVARHETAQLHHALLASLHDHVAILDAHGVIVEVNDAWRRHASAPNGAPLRRAGVGDNFPDQCRIACEQGDVPAAAIFTGVMNVLTCERRRFEMEFDDDRGTRHDRFALSVEALERADGGAIVRRTDVTARRAAQIELEEQRLALSHLARVTVLGQLSGALAHELNQPLAAIASNADAARRLLQRYPPDIEELDQILEDIVTSNHRAAQVIRRLRALLNRGETRLQPLDASELVNEVLELAHAELVSRRVAAIAVIAPNLPLVLGDRVQLQQVLLNLILNACEAMGAIPSGDRRLAVIVTTDARKNVQLSVRDSGTGIPAPLIDRLFEPFVTTKAEGLGLGLSISRTIVAAHGGRLWAENNIDRGATVHCLLVSAPALPLSPPTLVDEPPRRSSVVA